jgi:hypothetical protein
MGRREQAQEDQIRRLRESGYAPVDDETQKEALEYGLVVKYAPAVVGTDSNPSAAWVPEWFTMMLQGDSSQAENLIPEVHRHPDKDEQALILTELLMNRMVGTKRKSYLKWLEIHGYTEK